MLERQQNHLLIERQQNHILKFLHPAVKDIIFNNPNSPYKHEQFSGYLSLILISKKHQSLRNSMNHVLLLLAITSVSPSIIKGCGMQTANAGMKTILDWIHNHITNISRAAKCDNY